MSPLTIPLAAAGWELFWWADRLQDRRTLYSRAKTHARSLGLPLIVVGAPDQGPTPGPGCGDLVLDIAPSACPNSMQVDITKSIPLPDNSAVIFVSCVLEYVDDFAAAWRELQRIAPNRVYVCRVQPWTLTAHLYPGAQRILDRRLCEPRRELAAGSRQPAGRTREPAAGSRQPAVRGSREPAAGSRQPAVREAVARGSTAGCRLQAAGYFYVNT